MFSWSKSLQAPALRPCHFSRRAEEAEAWLPEERDLQGRAGQGRADNIREWGAHTLDPPEVSVNGAQLGAQAEKREASLLPPSPSPSQLSSFPTGFLPGEAPGEPVQRVTAIPGRFRSAIGQHLGQSFENPYMRRIHHQKPTAHQPFHCSNWLSSV